MSAHDWRSVPSDFGSFDVCADCSAVLSLLRAIVLEVTR